MQLFLKISDFDKEYLQAWAVLVEAWNEANKRNRLPFPLEITIARWRVHITHPDYQLWSVKRMKGDFSHREAHIQNKRHATSLSFLPLRLMSVAVQFPLIPPAIAFILKYIHPIAIFIHESICLEVRVPYRFSFCNCRLDDSDRTIVSNEEV